MIRKHTQSHLRTLLLTAFSVAVSLLIFWVFDTLENKPLQRVENATYDQLFKLRPYNKSHILLKPDDIVIVDIDDESIEELGRVNSWPRLYDARVINHIATGNPLAIGIDFLYTEPDTLPVIYSQLLQSSGIHYPNQIIKALSTDDSLAAAIGSAGNVYLSMLEKTGSHSIDSTYSDLLRTIRTPLNDQWTISRYNPLLPVEKLASQAAGIGSINLPSDIDGVLRHYSLLHRLPQKNNDSIHLLANFTFYLLSDLVGATAASWKLDGSSIFIMDSLRIPINKSGAFRINWLGSEEKFRTISYYKLLRKVVPSEFFNNKIVFLGSSATGMEDLKTAPHTSDRIPGVEIHATALLNMTNQAFITEISPRRFIFWMMLIAFITAFVIRYIKPIYALVFLALVLLIEVAIITWAFYAHQLMIPVILMILTTIITALITNTYNYFTEQKQKRNLKNAFGTYVSSTVVNKILDDPKSLMLGGTKKTLSVLFSDIRGFTKYSERMDPQQVVSIINKYLSTMSEPILAHEGTIDKFIGDAIFAIFGAPLENSDHATEACEVALEMIQKLKEVNDYLIGEGLGPLKIGIGINTGEMTIGNIGSTKRFDYTAIGDSVNLGSRIEGLTKHFNVNILVSEFTKAACQQSLFLFRPLPETRVQGKEQSVGIYELIDLAVNRAKYEPDLSIWDQAHAAFMHKDLTSALDGFKKYLIHHPADVSCVTYIEKCEQYLIHPEEYTNSIDMDKK